MKRSLTSVLSVYLFVCGCVAFATSQDLDDIQQGIKAYGTYLAGDIDLVSMTNGNLTLHIPLVNYPQRGKVDLGYYLVYNNKNYVPHKICPGDECYNEVWLATDSPFSGVLGSPVTLIADRQFTTKEVFVQETGTSVGFDSFSVVESDGASHQLAWITSILAETVDGTGLQVSGSTVVDENGTNYTTVEQEDTNGNQVMVGGKDTVGRTITSIPSQSGSGAGNCPSGPLPVDSYSQLVFPGPNGGSSTFLFCYAEVSVVYLFYGPDGNLSEDIDFLQSVVLPNGTAWTFSYSTDGYGDLKQIIFPTGGTIAYNWEAGPACSAAMNPRYLTSRTVNANDGTGTHIWTYTYNGNTTTVEDPLGDNTVYTNTDLSYCSAYTTEVQYYNGVVSSSNLVKTVSTAYSSTQSPFGPEPVGNTNVYMNIVPTQVTTTWALTSGQPGPTSQLTKTYDSGFTFPSPRYNDSSQYTGLYGKVVVQDDYDYGTTNGSPGSLLRQTNTCYLWQSTTANSNCSTYNANYASYLSNNMLNLIYSAQITDGTNQKAFTQYGYDEYALQSSGLGSAQNLDTSVWTGTLRGNQTSVNRWLNLPTVQTLKHTTTYYDTGMPSVAKDPLLNSTTYIYSGTYQDAYPTQIENTLGQSIYYNYDYDTGLLSSTTDLNGQLTSEMYDTNWRLTNETRPDGGQTSFCYSDLGGSSCSQSGPPYEVVITKSITSSQNEVMTAVVDGLGRLSQTQLNSDTPSMTYTQTVYDGLGRKSKVYNPTRCSPPTTQCTGETTWGYTTYVYDVLDRVNSVTEQDGSATSTSYSAFPCTTVTDEVGNSRESCVDGLGRIKSVFEEPSSSNYETDYTHDPLGNLLSVTQKGNSPSNSSNWRTRSLTYDSLSRLLSAKNPESGTISYTYDADGNVLTKKAPSPNQTSGLKTVATTYTYDGLNRLTGKSYADSYTSNPATASVAYGYDGVALTGCTISPPGLTDNYPLGLRTSMCDGSGGTSWSHDKMGRTLQDRRTIGSVKGEYDTDVYNLDGSVATMTVPGYTVAYTYSNAGRPITAKNNADPFNYVTSATYDPAGHLTGMTMGSAPITISNSFNNRLQPSVLSASTAAATIMSLSFDFHSSTKADNGNVYQIANNRDSSRTQNFTYDALNRIKAASTTGTNWGESYTIDAWANLTNIAGNPFKGQSESLNCSPANTDNQLNTCFTYDAAGNMTVNGSATYTYDAENRLISAGGMSYIYDGDGKRVEKCTAGTTAGTCGSGATGTMYWMGWRNEAASETDLSGNVIENYIFFGGQRIARRDASPVAVHFYFSDHLGTHSLITDANGDMPPQEESDFYPYGGEIPITTGDSNHYKFTGKERDAESGDDYFGARYYASTVGRFLTPDPLFATPLHVVNPQRWNMYAYVVNNPTNFIDPDGKDAIAVNFTKEVPIGGHEGIIVVHADGSATYARFGPVTPASPADAGKVTVQALDPVARGADGLPTGAAYKQLSDEVAKIEGQPADTVRMNYFKTSEADSIALDNWMQQWKTAHAPDYNVTSQNCAVFCIAGLIQGHAIENKNISIVPNRLFDLLAKIATENWVGQQPKEKVTTRICWTDDKGKKVCQ